MQLSRSRCPPSPTHGSAVTDARLRRHLDEMFGETDNYLGEAAVISLQQLGLVASAWSGVRIWRRISSQRPQPAGVCSPACTGHSPVTPAAPCPVRAAAALPRLFRCAGGGVIRTDGSAPGGAEALLDGRRVVFIDVDHTGRRRRSAHHVGIR
jgi:hypothetical protein